MTANPNYVNNGGFDKESGAEGDLYINSQLNGAGNHMLSKWDGTKPSTDVPLTNLVTYTDTGLSGRYVGLFLIGDILYLLQSPSPTGSARACMVLGFNKTTLARVETEDARVPFTATAYPNAFSRGNLNLQFGLYEGGSLLFFSAQDQKVYKFENTAATTVTITPDSGPGDSTVITRGSPFSAAPTAVSVSAAIGGETDFDLTESFAANATRFYFAGGPTAANSVKTQSRVKAYTHEGRSQPEEYFNVANGGFPTIYGMQVTDAGDKHILIETNDTGRGGGNVDKSRVRIYGSASTLTHAGVRVPNSDAEPMHGGFLLNGTKYTIASRASGAGAVSVQGYSTVFPANDVNNNLKNLTLDGDSTSLGERPNWRGMIQGNLSGHGGTEEILVLESDSTRIKSYTTAWVRQGANDIVLPLAMSSYASAYPLDFRGFALVTTSTMAMLFVYSHADQHVYIFSRTLTAPPDPPPVTPPPDPDPDGNGNGETPPPVRPTVPRPPPGTVLPPPRPAPIADAVGFLKAFPFYAEYMFPTFPDFSYPNIAMSDNRLYLVRGSVVTGGAPFVNVYDYAGGRIESEDFTLAEPAPRTGLRAQGPIPVAAEVVGTKLYVLRMPNKVNTFSGVAQAWLERYDIETRALEERWYVLEGAPSKGDTLAEYMQFFDGNLHIVWRNTEWIYNLDGTFVRSRSGGQPQSILTATRNYSLTHDGAAAYDKNWGAVSADDSELRDGLTRVYSVAYRNGRVVVLDSGGMIYWFGAPFASAPTTNRQIYRQFAGMLNWVRAYDCYNESASGVLDPRLINVGMVANDNDRLFVLAGSSDISSYLRLTTFTPQWTVPTALVGDIIVPHQGFTTLDTESRIPMDTPRYQIKGFEWFGDRRQQIFTELIGRV